MMEREGADPDRARLIEFFPAEPDPLDIAGGDIDCVYGSFWGWEGALARLENENIRWKEVSELGAPWCHSQIIAVNRTLAENEPGLVTGFLRATGRGFAAAAMEPERAAESMIMVAPVFTRAQFTAAVGLIAPTWRTGPGWGTHNLPLIRDYAQWLSRKGFLAHTCHDQEFTDELLT
jgi:ABC-type nitrate/sulfonate/bicarbonate transport system substrate-binding protein